MTLCAKTRIVFLGSRPLGKRVLQFLLSQPDVEVVGMIVLPASADRYWIESPANLEVPVIEDISELIDIKFDLGVSMNYWKLITDPILSRPKLGFVNVHHSYNLRLRGRNCATFAILYARHDNILHHGSTLHYISKQLDAGKIIASYACPITESDTARSLFDRVEEVSFAMIQEWLPRVWRERVISYDPPNEFHVFRSSAINDKHVNLNMLPLRVYDTVRAFIFPPFEGPFALYDGRKRYLTTLASAGSELVLDAGAGRRVYWVDSGDIETGDRDKDVTC